MMSFTLRALVIAAFCVGIAACAPDSDRDTAMASGTAPMKIAVSTTPHANQNRPVSIDVVYILDASAARKLSDLDARQWFEKREQWLGKFGNDLRLASAQVPPGVRDALLPVPDKAAEAIEVLAFVDMDSGDPSRQSLMGRQEASLVVQQSGWMLED